MALEQGQAQPMIFEMEECRVTTELGMRVPIRREKMMSSSMEGVKEHRLQ